MTSCGGTSWLMSITCASGLIPAMTPFMTPTKGSTVPKSVVRVISMDLAEARMNLTKKTHRVNPRPLESFLSKHHLFSAIDGMDIRTDVTVGKILAGGVR